MIYAFRIIWKTRPYFLLDEDKTNGQFESWVGGGACREAKDITQETFNDLNDGYRILYDLSNNRVEYEIREYKQ